MIASDIITIIAVLLDFFRLLSDITSISSLQYFRARNYCNYNIFPFNLQGFRGIREVRVLEREWQGIGGYCSREGSLRGRCLRRGR